MMVQFVVVLGNAIEEDFDKDRRLSGLITIDIDGAIGKAYGVVGTPSAVVVDKGRIFSYVVAGADQVRLLVRQFGQLARSTQSSAVRQGSPAPQLSLRDLDGNSVLIGGSRRSPTVLLFWSTVCGYCMKMLPELQQWERERNVLSPEVVVISDGTELAARAMGLLSTVLLDNTFTAGTAFGIEGTPSAVVIDQSGCMAQPVAIGRKNILELLEGLSKDDTDSFEPAIG
jgi:protein-disulfide isomerase